MTPEQRHAWEQVGLEADALSAVVQSMQMPLPDSMHVGALRNILPEMIQRLRQAVVNGTGENPWETNP